MVFSLFGGKKKEDDVAKKKQKEEEEAKNKKKVGRRASAVEGGKDASKKEGSPKTKRSDTTAAATLGSPEIAIKVVPQTMGEEVSQRLLQRRASGLIGAEKEYTADMIPAPLTPRTPTTSGPTRYAAAGFQSDAAAAEMRSRLTLQRRQSIKTEMAFEGKAPTAPLVTSAGATEGGPVKSKDKENQERGKSPAKTPRSSPRASQERAKERGKSPQMEGFKSPRRK